MYTDEELVWLYTLKHVDKGYRGYQSTLHLSHKRKEKKRKENLTHPTPINLLLLLLTRSTLTHCARSLSFFLSFFLSFSCSPVKTVKRRAMKKGEKRPLGYR
jgi:hypothetical protein